MLYCTRGHVLGAKCLHRGGHCELVQRATLPYYLPRSRLYTAADNRGEHERRCYIYDLREEQDPLCQLRVQHLPPGSTKRHSLYQQPRSGLASLYRSFTSLRRSQDEQIGEVAAHSLDKSGVGRHPRSRSHLFIAVEKFCSAHSLLARQETALYIK